MIQHSKTVTPETLVSEVRALKDQGWRFVTCTCLELDADTLEMIVHLDKDLELTHLRLSIAKGKALPSLSGVYFAAFLVENEMRDQFGLEFTDLVLDFGGTLYLEGDVKSTPFCRYGIKDAANGDADAANAEDS